MAHADLETAEAAQAALAGLPEDKQKLYWDVILSRLPELVRCILEARMIDLKNYEYQSDFARKYYGQGREEGREEGLRRAVIALVCARLPELRGEIEGRLGGEPRSNWSSSSPSWVPHRARTGSGPCWKGCGRS